MYNKCIGRKVDKTLNLLPSNIYVYTLEKTMFIKKKSGLATRHQRNRERDKETAERPMRVTG